jgi:translation elongation factor EF-G
MSSKRCFKCLLELPLTAFYKHPMMGDGHLGKCKDCTKKDTIENRLAKIEYYRQYDRARASQPHRVAARAEYAKSDAGRRKMAAGRRAWEARNPDKKRATTAIQNAVRDGKIKKEPCFVCGAEKTDAHHASYDLPLHVTWLCEKHHAELHKEHRERERMAA